MWKQYFSPNHSLKTEVSWNEFLRVLTQHLSMPPTTKVFVALKSILVKDHRDVVSIEEFGNILKWFGSLEKDSKGDNFLQTIQVLLTKKWFHGDISLPEAQTRLTGAEPGTFLIRFSSKPGSFALSRMIENSNKERVIVHIRITHKPGGKYSFSVDDQSYEYESLTDLVKAQELQLGNACSGSKYWATFRVKQKHQGYINSVKSNTVV